MATKTADLTAQVDGTQTSFTIAEAYTAGTLRVYLDGLLQRPIADGGFYQEAPGGFTTSEPPLVGDELQVQYEVSAGDVIGFIEVRATGIDPTQP